MLHRLERVGTWPAVILGARVLAAAALVVGLGQALPILLTDLILRYAVLPPVTTYYVAVRWSEIVAQPPGTAVLALAAVAAGCTMYRGEGRLDSAAVALVVLGWAFAFLPESVRLVGVRSLAMDGVLVIGFAGGVVMVASGRLSPRGSVVILGLLLPATLIALDALLADAAGDGSTYTAVIVAAVIVALVLSIAYRSLPWAALGGRQAGSGVRRAVLVAMPSVLAGGAVLAAAAGEAATAEVLAAVLAVVLLAYGAILLALRVSRPLRYGGHVEVDRPPARVFRELTDFRTPLAPGAPERSLHPLDDGPIGVGSRLRWETGVGRTRTVTVTAFDAPSVFEYEDVASATVRVWYGIEPAECGSIVRWRQVFDLPLYWWLRPGMQRSLSRTLEATAERLRVGRRFADDEPVERG